MIEKRILVAEASAASAGDGLVLAGSPFPARAWRPSVARGHAAVPVPGRRGRPPRLVVLQRQHADQPAAADRSRSWTRLGRNCSSAI